MRMFVMETATRARKDTMSVDTAAPKTTPLGPGPVRCRERLGGVLKFYYCEAA
jgi:hypothetical protein